MRYYKIEIAAPGGDVLRTYTSHPGGQVDLSALDVELDLPVATEAQPVGGAYVRIWGIPLQQIAQAADLNGKTIRVYGGMQKGLPLANPAQAGLIASGSILQAFGSWIGAEQTLDIYLGPPTGTPDAPKNLVFNWLKGQPLQSAIQTMLKTAFPDSTMTGQLSGQLVLPHDEQGFYQGLDQFADYIRKKSIAILGAGAPGVDLVVRDKEVFVHDGSSQSAPRQIAFFDLIGQPTYREPGVISVTTVMRADIRVGDYVRLPPSVITNTAASASQFRDQAAFQGTYFVKRARAVGRLRQPDASNWISVLDCAGPVSGSASTTTPVGSASIPGSAAASATGSVNATAIPLTAKSNDASIAASLATVRTA